MNKKINFGAALFPQYYHLRSTLMAVFLPLLFLLLLVSCGGGAKSVETAETADAGQVPEIDEPYISDFYLGVGDELLIRVWKHQDLLRRVKLDASGEFYYPFLGYIKAGGMGIRELRTTIREGLERYYVDPQVGVEVVSMRSLKIFVLGEVRKPGVFVLDGTETAVEAIGKAGGFTDDSDKSSIVLIRGDMEDPELQRLDMQDFLNKAKGGQNILLEPGDVLYVPKSFVGDLRSFFKTARIVIRPIVDLERAIILEPRVEDILQGDDGGSTRIQ